MTYDSDGNLTSYAGTNYNWDARNQLGSLSGGNSNTYGYDALGRRRVNDVSRKMLFDGDNAVEEFSSTTPEAGRITGGTDEFFQRDTTAGSYYPLVDALGSVIALTNSSGAITTNYTYDPFGNTTVSGTTVDNPYAYTGRENVLSWLYYYRARYYQPRIGRFISEDPIGFGGGGANLYRYAADSPTNFTDPEGLWDPEAHDALLQHALGGCVPQSIIDRLKANSRKWDKDSQATSLSNYHSMGVPGQTPQEAANGINQVTNDSLNSAHAEWLDGDWPAAWWDMAVGMHALMDSTSPADVDSSGNPITWYGWYDPFRSNTFDHSVNDDLWGNEKTKDITPGIYLMEDILLRNAYQRVTGDHLSCGCAR